MGYHRIARLHPRADPDRAGRRRSMWHDQANRDGATRMLLSGRGGAAAWRAPLAAARQAGRNAESNLGLRRPRPAAQRLGAGRLAKKKWPARGRPLATLYNLPYSAACLAVALCADTR